MPRKSAISVYLASIGKKGGKVSSPAKRAAAKANGAKFKRRRLPCIHCGRQTLERDASRRANCCV